MNATIRIHTGVFLSRANASSSLVDIYQIQILKAVIWDRDQGTHIYILCFSRILKPRFCTWHIASQARGNFRHTYRLVSLPGIHECVYIFDSLVHHIKRSFVIFCVSLNLRRILNVVSFFQDYTEQKILTDGIPHLSMISLLNSRRLSALGVLYPKD
jgi:hypothetical protein